MKNVIYNLRFYLYRIFFPSKIFQLCEEFRCKGKYLDTKIMYIFDNNIEELPKELTRYSFSCFYVKSIGFPKNDSILKLEADNSFYISIYAHDKLYDFEFSDYVKGVWYKGKSELIMIDNDIKSYIDPDDTLLYRNFVYKITMDEDDYYKLTSECVQWCDLSYCNMKVRAKIILNECTQAAMDVVAFLDVASKS
ncbi:MAG: hypothetical protein SPF22_07635 [Candidatus Onthovivens sp.]|nr:hypothetical protein [Candidatus Onthovivens sp.]